MKIHIYRYDDVTPTEERPWIMSFKNDMDTEIVADALDFPTWGEAVGFLASIGEYMEYG
jgi:hypothetical protein